MEKRSQQNEFHVMKRIAFIGPESTAKSTLCAQLASHYNTLWVPEYAREYISNLLQPYKMDDVLHCIKMQMEENKRAESMSNKILFADNEAINGMVWLIHKYGSCPQWILDEIKNNPFDLYLLTYPDIEFVADNVRENGDRRIYFFEWYKKELDERNLNYAVITGKGEDRFENALNAVEEFLKK